MRSATRDVYQVPLPLITARCVRRPFATHLSPCKKRNVRAGRGVSARVQNADRFCSLKTYQRDFRLLASVPASSYLYVKYDKRLAKKPLLYASKCHAIKWIRITMLRINGLRTISAQAIDSKRS